MFVRTPRGQIFPATFYYGQSGASIGGWSPDYRVFLFLEEIPTFIIMNIIMV